MKYFLFLHKNLFFIFTKIFIFYYDLIWMIFELIQQIHFLRLDGFDMCVTHRCDGLL